ncbi:MAG: LysR family transcriptional regulator [Clostridiales Family XIII bacterium]|jgi:DNA-binding transcriptional LysR family regulator|nr:LysR family transcriptional regulator [Clostridiales Family XIII bacterium]
MNINHLRYFQAVCKYGSITKASEVLYIAQPTVTSAIKDIENELGFQLLVRSKNSISLTIEGVSFLEMLNDLMASFDNFYNMAVDLGQNRQATLKLGIPAILGTFFFDRIFPEFERRNPNIRLTVHQTPTIIGLEMIKDSFLDFFIGIKEGDTPSCDYNKLFETELVFWARRGHPLSREKHITGELIKNQSFIMAPRGSYHFKMVSERYGNIPLNVVMHSNQISTIRYMLLNSTAVTVLYEQVFENDDAVCKIPLEEPIVAEIGVFRKKHTYVTDAMKSFLRFLTSVAD